MVHYNRSGNSTPCLYKIRLCWPVLSHIFLASGISFTVQYTCAPFLSQHHMISLMWFSSVMMVCSQAAVLGWKASLSMKSFLLTSRCRFVREWLAPQIMEGLTTHLNEQLEIEVHLFVLFLNMVGLCVHFEVCYLYICIIVCPSKKLSRLLQRVGQSGVKCFVLFRHGELKYVSVRLLCAASISLKPKLTVVVTADALLPLMCSRQYVAECPFCLKKKKREFKISEKSLVLLFVTFKLNKSSSVFTFCSNSGTNGQREPIFFIQNWITLNTVEYILLLSMIIIRFTFHTLFYQKACLLLFKKKSVFSFFAVT